MTEEIRLVIPAEEDFRSIAHLVASGLAVRLGLTYDEIGDLQVAIEVLLALRDDEEEIVVSLGRGDGSLLVAVGPFDAGSLRELDEEDEDLGLRRVLETVADTYEVEHRGDGSWVELTKRIAAAAGAT